MSLLRRHFCNSVGYSSATAFVSEASAAMIAQRKRPVIRVGPRFAGLPPDEPAQAPAVAVLEPESAPPTVKVPPITVIPPHKADAKPVPQSAISPDTRKKIEESLASKPNVIPDQRTILVADTSEGTKSVKAT